MDTSYFAQADNLVKKATVAAGGSPDWNVILRIVGLLESRPIMGPTFLHAILQRLARDDITTKMNVLVLIDALFKNSKGAQLEMLQAPSMIRGMSELRIIGNPKLHNFLYKCAPAWVGNCMKYNCLERAFADWQTRICASYFVPKLTSKLKEKLFKDLESALEVLILFTRCVLSGLADGGNIDDKLFGQITPNVLEVARRSAELEPTIADKQLRAVLTSVRDFCGLCQQVMNQRSKKENIDGELLAKQMARTQRVIEKAKVATKEEEVVKKRIPVRRAGLSGEEMTVEEFFSEFDKMKSAPDATQPVVDLLGPVEDAPRRDDLIDALIDI